MPLSDIVSNGFITPGIVSDAFAGYRLQWVCHHRVLSLDAFVGYRLQRVYHHRVSSLMSSPGIISNRLIITGFRLRFLRWVSPTVLPPPGIVSDAFTRYPLKRTHHHRVSSPMPSPGIISNGFVTTRYRLWCLRWVSSSTSSSPLGIIFDAFVGYNLQWIRHNLVLSPMPSPGIVSNWFVTTRYRIRYLRRVSSPIDSSPSGIVSDTSTGYRL